VIATTVLEEYLHHTQTKRKPPEKFSFTGIKASPIIISFDQALNFTGVVIAQISDHGKVWVLHHETIRTTNDGLTSFEQTFARTDQLRDKVFDLLVINDDIAEAVIEQPPIGSGFRTESSTFAAYAISRACRGQQIPYTYMQPRHARVVVVGRGNADKKGPAHIKLAELVPETASRKWNENTRDALVNLLAHVIDSQEGS
jgi:Holliday junction resolvasome RuvABC endonuclease subunit